MYDNPQITKARRKNFRLEIKEFFELSMLVEISEAIRLLPMYIKYLFILFKNSIFLYANSLKDINDNENISIKVSDKKEFVNKKESGKDNEKFYQWLAGIIDGDGCFYYQKKCTLV